MTQPLENQPALAFTLDLSEAAKNEIGVLYTTTLHKPGMPAWSNLGAKERREYFDQMLATMIAQDSVIESIGESIGILLVLDTSERVEAFIKGIHKGQSDGEDEN